MALAFKLVYLKPNNQKPLRLITVWAASVKYRSLHFLHIMAKKRRTLSDLIRDEVEQKSLFDVDAYSGDYSPDWATDVGSCVPQKEPTHEPTHEPKYTQWVQTYWVSRRGLKHQYYRFCYLKTDGDIGSCVRVHIPGGNTKSDKAQSLQELVVSAIALGHSPTQIIALIKNAK